MKKAALLAFPLTLIGADGAWAADSKELMAKAFMEWCSAPIPSWEAMNAKATAEKLQVVQHRKMPLPKGEFIEDKIWSVDDKRGAYAVDAIHSNHEGKPTASCSVYFAELLDDDLPAYLGKQLKLGKPATATKSEDGKQLTFWDTAPDVRIMLTSGSKGGLKGAAINRMQTLEPGR